MMALSKRNSFQWFIIGGAFITFIVWYFEGYQIVFRNFSSNDWSTFDFEGRAHDDPELIEFIRHRMVYPPPEPLPYNLVHEEETDFSMHGQGPELKKIFGNQRNGFFVESGAFTGEDYSPTLFWERERTWTGVLVEPHPYYYSLLAGKNRRSVILHAGLSPTNTASTLTFVNQGWGTKIVNETVRKSLPPSKHFTVPCFPLTSILAAVGISKVDLLSLDIEGVEIHVLRTLDFSALDIHVVMFEYSPVKYPPLQNHLEMNGYKQWAKLQYDGIFIRTK